MNTELSAQEIINSAGNYFMSMRDDYVKANEKETNIIKYVENNKAIDVLNQAINLIINFQNKLNESTTVNVEHETRN